MERNSPKIPKIVEKTLQIFTPQTQNSDLLFRFCLKTDFFGGTEYFLRDKIKIKNSENIHQELQ